MIGRKELVSAVAQNLDLYKKDVAPILDELYEVIIEYMAKGESIQIINFATFTFSVRKPKKSINLKTNEEMMMPAMTLVKFVPGQRMKDAVREISEPDKKKDEEGEDENE